jgi:putative tricarboxylic transport membrane protein
MKFNDLTLGLIVLVAGIAIYLSSLQFSPIPGQSYGAETMPRTIAFLSLGLGLFMIGKSLAVGMTRPGIVMADWTRSPASLGGLATAILLILGYILFSDAVGFVPIAFAVMLVLMLTLRVKLSTAILVSLVAAVVIQQAFGRLLLVPLPRNAFLGFLW